MKSIPVLVLGTCLFFVCAQVPRGWAAAPVSVEIRSGARVLARTRDIQQANVTQDQDTRQWEVAIRLTPAAAKRFRRFTRTHVGQTASYVVDGKVVSSPVIRAEIVGGNGAFPVSSRDEGERIARGIEQANGK